MKTLILMRGLPGSGKTTLAKEIQSQNPGSIILSTDEFWRKNGKYQFDPSRLDAAHLWNQQRCMKAMQDQVDMIIIDNTNIRLAEMQPYAQLAWAYNYMFMTKVPTTDWAFEVDDCFHLNSHNVPHYLIEQMNKDWVHNPTFDQILAAELPKSARRNVLWQHSSPRDQFTDIMAGLTGWLDTFKEQHGEYVARPLEFHIRQLTQLLPFVEQQSWETQKSEEGQKKLWDLPGI